MIYLVALTFAPTPARPSSSGDLALDGHLMFKKVRNNTRSFKKAIYSFISLTRVANGSKKKATGTAAGSRSMKRKLDTGVEVYDNKVKKNQRHTTNEKPNMYLDIFNRGVEEESHWH